MDESRSIPTATSFRTLAVDTLDAKRRAINEQLAEKGVKVSFTHLIACKLHTHEKEACRGVVVLRSLFNVAAAF